MGNKNINSKNKTIEKNKLLYTIYDENNKILKIGPAIDILDIKKKNKIKELIYYEFSQDNIKKKIELLINEKNYSNKEQIYYDILNKNIVVVSLLDKL